MCGIMQANRLSFDIIDNGTAASWEIMLTSRQSVMSFFVWQTPHVRMHTADGLAGMRRWTGG